MAVLLSKFENMSYADIAVTMDMSQEAIKSLLSRAQIEPEGSLGTVSRTRRPPGRGLRMMNQSQTPDAADHGLDEHIGQLPGRRIRRRRGAPGRRERWRPIRACGKN